ncbi:Protein N-terminal glutamine amidohydrolase [Saitoella coloradoensis]
MPKDSEEKHHSSGSDPDKQHPTPDDLAYTASFCEENVWHQCQKWKEDHPEDFDRKYAVFVLTASERTPMFNQKLCKESKAMFWTHHVLSITCPEEGSDDPVMVWDQDTSLDFPCPFPKYCVETFKPTFNHDEALRRRYRVVPAQDYLDHFHSDRRHMKDDGGEYLSEPPEWEEIRGGNGEHNLHNYLSYEEVEHENEEEAKKYGKLYEEPEFFERFGGTKDLVELEATYNPNFK